MAYVPTAYITLQIQSNSFNIADFNTAVDNGDTTCAQDILTNIINIIDSVKIGTHNAKFTVSSSTVAGTVSGQTGGVAQFTIDLT
jgi:hypothetical protein